MTRRRKPGAGVPPLRNDAVTGLTPPKQDAVIRESGTDPDRGDAAREFLEEQRDQAADTERSAPREGVVGPSAGDGGRDALRGSAPDPGAETELRKHWDPESQRKP